MTSAERQKDCRLQKKIQQIWEEHHDHKGRLHDETSGGNSMSKITRIVAATDRNELLGGQKPVRGAARMFLIRPIRPLIRSTVTKQLTILVRRRPSLRGWTIAGLKVSVCSILNALCIPLAATRIGK
jgi:hypothetical protein